MVSAAGLPAADGVPARSAIATPLSAPGTVSGWIPSWSNRTALAAVTANRDLVKTVSPFWYSLVVVPRKGLHIESAQLGGGTHAGTVAALHAAGVKVIPTLTDTTPPRYLATALASGPRRASLATSLARFVVRNRLDGVDLDWENFAFSDGARTWAKTRPAWVDFVRLLSAQLRARGKALTVSVPPMYGNGRTASSGYWVYDYAAIASSVSQLRVMAYDYSVAKPGPIAPLLWDTTVIAFTTSVVPAAKVALGVPAYGRSWVVATQGRCPVGTNNGVVVLSSAGWDRFAGSIGGSVRYDTTVGENTMTYRRVHTGIAPSVRSVRPGSRAAVRQIRKTTTCTLTRTAWWESSRAIAARTQLAQQAHLASIAVWSLDAMTAETWSVLRGNSHARAKAREAAVLVAARRAR